MMTPNSIGWVEVLTTRFSMEREKVAAKFDQGVRPGIWSSARG